jgi:hypothetical protein
LATTRSTTSTLLTLNEGGADQAEDASFIAERDRIAQIEAQRSKTVRWTVRLTNGSFLHPDQPMTLCDLFDFLEEKLNIDPATDLETAAYFDEPHQMVIVVRPRGGTCDEALSNEVLEHEKRIARN